MIFIRAHTKYRTEFRTRLLSKYTHDIEHILPGDSGFYINLKATSTLTEEYFLREYVSFINTKV